MDNLPHKGKSAKESGPVKVGIKAAIEIPDSNANSGSIHEDPENRPIEKVVSFEALSRQTDNEKNPSSPNSPERLGDLDNSEKYSKQISTTNLQD